MSDVTTASHVLYSQLVDLGAQCSDLQQQLITSRLRHQRLQRFVDVLEPVARLYVDAFADDERMTLAERLRLQAVEDTLHDMDLLRGAGNDV